MSPEQFARDWWLAGLSINALASELTGVRPIIQARAFNAYARVANQFESDPYFSLTEIQRYA